MLDKKTYLDLKREIRYLCKKNVIKLCDDMELTEDERTLLMHFYNNDSKNKTCMEMNIGTTTYSKYMKVLFTKINDYKNTLK